MAIGYDGFIERFPEYRDGVDRRLVEAKLAEARLQVNVTVWGTKADLGIGYLAAHLLSASPGGQHARLIPANAKPVRGEALTTYEREYLRLMRTVAHGFRVTGKNVTTVTEV